MTTSRPRGASPTDLPGAAPFVRVLADSDGFRHVGPRPERTVLALSVEGLDPDRRQRLADAARHAGLPGTAAPGGAWRIVGPEKIVGALAADLAEPDPPLALALGEAARHAGRHRYELPLPGGGALELEEGRPLLMGILNTTPDSFSDGGRYADRDAAVERGLRMAAEGADLIDVGGESTRPGAAPVGRAEELDRIGPVIEALARQVATPLSVDTRHAATAREALRLGASVVNDVSGLSDPDIAAACAAAGAPAVLMHMRGTPADMRERAAYDDVVREVVQELAARLRDAEARGLARDRILVDPGIGFAKTAEQSLALLRELRALRVLGCGVLVGVSRKSFLAAVEPSEPADRLYLTLGAATACVDRGANVLRVHDVRETRQAVAAHLRISGR